MDGAVQVTFDAADPHMLARWWAGLLHYRIEDSHDLVTRLLDRGVITEAEVIRIDGRLFLAGAVAASDPGGRGPRLFFQKVPEPKSAKNRVHLDVPVQADRLDDEVRRLVASGASLTGYSTYPGHRAAVMQDPEGNEFCLHEPAAAAGSSSAPRRIDNAVMAELTAAQVQALVSFAGNPPMTTGELGRSVTDAGMCLDDRVTVVVVRSLVDLGLVERTPAAHLGKYRITAKGRARVLARMQDPLGHCPTMPGARASLALDGTVLAGSLEPRALQFVSEWARLRSEE